MSPARAVLRNIHSLTERRYAGGVDAIVELLDFEQALLLAGLTDKQREAIELVYDDDLTQVDASKRMGILPSTMTKHLAEGIAKIDAVYMGWEETE